MPRNACGGGTSSAAMRALPGSPASPPVAWLQRYDNRSPPLTAAVALSLSLTATLYPGWRAARACPANALRHE